MKITGNGLAVGCQLFYRKTKDIFYNVVDENEVYHRRRKIKNICSRWGIPLEPEAR